MSLRPVSTLRVSPPPPATSYAAAAAPSRLSFAIAPTVAIGAHYGASSDAALPIATIALSRLVRVKEANYLAAIVATPLAAAVLAALKAAMLRALIATIDPGLTAANIEVLFNLPGSSTKYKQQYEGMGFQGSLQARVPWSRLRHLVAALLDTLVVARQGPTGLAVGQLLLTATTPNAPSIDATATQAAIANLVASVEPALRQRLGSPATPSAASSSASSDRATPPPQGVQGGDVQVAPQADAAATNFAAGLQRLVVLRMRRPLDAAEAAEVAAALDEALSVLQAGGAAARQQLLSLQLADALASQPGAWLWATTLEATATNPPEVAALAAAIVDGASSVAAMLFARAAVVFGAPAGAAGDPSPALTLCRFPGHMPMHTNSKFTGRGDGGLWSHEPTRIVSTKQ